MMRKFFLVVLLAALIVPIAAFADNPNADLLEGAQKGNLPEVQAALKKGADIDTKTASGWTALMYAAYGGHTNVVKALLAKKANPETKDKQYGVDALMLASQNGDTNTVKALLAGGANPNATRTGKGTPPLMFAMNGNHAATVEALLAGGANPNLKFSDGSTPW